MLWVLLAQEQLAQEWITNQIIIIIIIIITTIITTIIIIITNMVTTDKTTLTKWITITTKMDFREVVVGEVVVDGFPHVVVVVVVDIMATLTREVIVTVAEAMIVTVAEEIPTGEEIEEEIAAADEGVAVDADVVEEDLMVETSSSRITDQWTKTTIVVWKEVGMTIEGIINKIRMMVFAAMKVEGEEEEDLMVAEAGMKVVEEGEEEDLMTEAMAEVVAMKVEEEEEAVVAADGTFVEAEVAVEVVAMVVVDTKK
jgi:hypothetical protein